MSVHLEPKSLVIANRFSGEESACPKTRSGSRLRVQSACFATRHSRAGLSHPAPAGLVPCGAGDLARVRHM